MSAGTLLSGIAAVCFILYFLSAIWFRGDAGEESTDITTSMPIGDQFWLYNARDVEGFYDTPHHWQGEQWRTRDYLVASAKTELAERGQLTRQSREQVEKEADWLSKVIIYNKYRQAK